MSISLLVESKVENGVEQSLLIPTNSEVLVFHRLSNGKRGRGQRWVPVTDLSALPNNLVTADPCGVATTERDILNAQIGVVTQLATKALGLPTVESVGEQSHAEVVSDLRDRLIVGDATLNQYLRDNRRVNPVVLKPITPEATTEFYPATASAPVAPAVAEVAPSNVVSLPQANLNKPVELAKVPDKMWSEKYLNRKIVGKLLDFDVLDCAFENHQNVLIRGHAGSGKTMCVLAWASARNYRYYNVSANVGLEPSHLFGAWTPTEQAGVFRWQDGPVTDLVRNGGVLLLNEIDFMPERITTVLFGLLDDRREIQLLENGGEVIKAHPDLVVIGDHNPNYRGSRPMNQAWKDRFAHKLEFEYDTSIERKLIKNASLLEVAKKLRAQADAGEIDTPISTRGLVAFVANVEKLGLDYAVASYVNGFLDDEREAIRLVMDTAKQNIGADFGIKIETAPAQSDEGQN